MKKIILFLAAVFLLAGCGKKESIILPEADDVSLVSVYAGDSVMEREDEEWISTFLTSMKESGLTDRKSVQDEPQTEEYAKIVFTVKEGENTVFVYEDGGKYYAEQPYVGIYEIDEEAYSMVNAEVVEQWEKSLEAGVLKGYERLKDGTWKCEDTVYQYRLELNGRMPNAVKDSCFVVLTDNAELTFEQVSKSLYSSIMSDFDVMRGSVIVEMR